MRRFEAVESSTCNLTIPGICCIQENYTVAKVKRLRANSAVTVWQPNAPVTRFHCGLLECSETRHTVQKIRHQAEDESPQLLLRQDMASLADVGVKVLQLIYFIESVSQFIDEIFFFHYYMDIKKVELTNSSSVLRCQREAALHGTKDTQQTTNSWVLPLLWEMTFLVVLDMALVSQVCDFTIFIENMNPAPRVPVFPATGGF